MSMQTEMRLGGSRWGRMFLHTVCLVQDHRFEWHWKGIVRELVRV
jgi:hypothetical protein